MAMSGHLQCFGRFIAGEIASSTHWIESGVDVKTGLDAVEKRKFFFPFQESNPVCASYNVLPYRRSHRTRVAVWFILSDNGCFSRSWGASFSVES
jgi:hypothetical protein